jgi:hypothetical protein
MPDPMPRPTRLRPVFAFLGARRFDRFFAMIFLAVAPAGLESCRLAFVGVKKNSEKNSEEVKE